MAEVIRAHQIRDDDWQILSDAEDGTTDSLPASRLVLPLARWLDVRKNGQADLGVWLAPHEDPAVLADAVQRIPLIAVHFPRAGDGRGYSIGMQLRTRDGFRGELRAFGEVLRDQFEALRHCGFDSLQPPAGRYERDELADWLACAPTVIPARPLDRRGARGH